MLRTTNFSPFLKFIRFHSIVVGSRIKTNMAKNFVHIMLLFKLGINLAAFSYFVYFVIDDSSINSLKRF